MNHRVAIWANGYQVCNGINLIFFANLSNWNDVMNVNEPLTKSPKYAGKIKTAYRADMAMMTNARCAGFGAALVSVNCDAESCAFGILLWRGKFFG